MKWSKELCNFALERLVQLSMSEVPEVFIGNILAKPAGLSAACLLISLLRQNHTCLSSVFWLLSWFALNVTWMRFLISPFLRRLLHHSSGMWEVSSVDGKKWLSGWADSLWGINLLSHWIVEQSDLSLETVVGSSEDFLLHCMCLIFILDTLEGSRYVLILLKCIAMCDTKIRHGAYNVVNS